MITLTLTEKAAKDFVGLLAAGFLIEDRGQVELTDARYAYVDLVEAVEGTSEASQAAREAFTAIAAGV